MSSRIERHNVVKRLISSKLIWSKWGVFWKGGIPKGHEETFRVDWYIHFCDGFTDTDVVKTSNCRRQKKKNENIIDTYILLFFLNFWILFIFLYNRFLLVINCIHISVYMSIPISHSSHHHPQTPPLSPLGVHTFVLYICVSISALQTSSSIPLF